jgi:hypothetical protein
MATKCDIENPMMKRKTYVEPLMTYCEFFATEDAAIAHCREGNAGLSSTDPGCCAVADGPGEWQDEDGRIVQANFAVVDL